jgi:alkylation response protein AidB-like acyl-CoA dehydrogenase
MTALAHERSGTAPHGRLQAEQRRKDTAIEILGPFGLIPRGQPRAVDNGLWHYELLWSRSATIYAGTSEVQRNIIAQRVLGLPR